jgi:hypothetical protein
MAWTAESSEKAAETRRQRAEERRQRAEAAGIPDSQPFISGEGRPDQERILSCHCGGVLVSELPQVVQDRILYQQTDEGIAEANEGRTGTGARTIQDEFSKACLQRKDGITERGMEPWEAPNPMADLAKAHIAPGMSPKFLSPARVDKDGTRGFEVVKRPNGDPVKLRNMVLGQMPIERVKARNKFYQDKSKAAVGDVKNTFMRDGGKMSVDSE